MSLDFGNLARARAKHKERPVNCVLKAQVRLRWPPSARVVPRSYTRHVLPPRVEPVVVRKRLPLQDRVFDVVPELNNQRDRPPLTRGSGKAFAEYPNSNEHYEGITVVQELSSDEPRKEETQHAV